MLCGRDGIRPDGKAIEDPRLASWLIGKPTRPVKVTAFPAFGGTPLKAVAKPETIS